MSADSEQRLLEGRILTPAGWVDGRLSIANGRIAAIDATPVSGPCPAAPAASVAAAVATTASAATAATASAAAAVSRNAALSGPMIVPGFIDLHVHGGGGADCMAGAAALRTLAQTHAQFGTTSLLATTMTAPRETLRQVLTALASECTSGAARADSARVLGIHLEGPYINRARLGAQPDAVVTAARDEVLHYLSLAPIRVVTLAPEIAHEPEVIAALASRGVRVQLGHTAATYEQAVDALDHGASGFTHLYNAMSPLLHRAPGAVGAALAHARFAELIPDLLHVHPGAMRVALRAIPCLYCVTDGTAACGMPDGDYQLGSQDVNKCLGAVRLADGTLAGSALTMDQALRNLVAIGLDIDDACDRLSRYPADYLGLTDRGRLVAGAYADINVIDADLTVRETFVEGVPVRRSGRRD